MASTELEISKADVRPSPFGNHSYRPAKEKGHEGTEGGGKGDGHVYYENVANGANPFR